MKTEQTPADLQNAPDNVVTLDQPIKRGAQSIESLTLRKPSSGELRGLHLLDLLQFDVAATMKILPRISQPTITEPEAAGMDPADLLACGQVIAGFFAAEAGEGGSLPDRVENAMADLAVTFHWAPDHMDRLSLTELMEWRERARVRSSADGE